jgi:hypothetical protein
MAATTVDRNTPVDYVERQTRLPLAVGAVVPAGVMVGVAAATGLVPTAGSSNTAGLLIVGRSEHKADQTAGDTDVTVGRGVYGFAGSAALIAAGQTMVGRKVYVVDNQTVGLASDASAGVVAGTLEEIENGVFYVSLGLDDISPTAIASGQFGAPVIFTRDFADVATADFDTVVPEKFELLEVIVQKRGGAGAAGNTVQVKKAAAAVTDAIVTNIADQVAARQGTIDDVSSTFNAGDTLRITNTKAGGNAALHVTIIGAKR